MIRLYDIIRKTLIHLNKKKIKEKNLTTKSKINPSECTSAINQNKSTKTRQQRSALDYTHHFNKQRITQMTSNILQNAKSKTRNNKEKSSGKSI